ncbi:PadR family transcriptional regulator [Micromonospora sp. DT31]|uniref:PadR family transcriptional regulator n=1 Tax=Micromonospora sp. DT31 TaxID=3393434 RepID=UPI003CEEB5AD
MSSRNLNATAASLLGFLQEGPLTGWDLVAAAQQRIGDFWSLTQSQVYRELASMAAVGLIEAGERGPRDRRPYSITDTGRAAFTAWLSRTPDDETIRFPLLLTVLFGRHLPPGRLAEIVAEHRKLHAERLAAYQQAREQLVGGPVDPHQLAPLEFGIRYEAAALAWFDDLPAEIRTGERPHQRGANNSQ